MLGFVPHVGIEQGISQFVDWVKEQKGGNDVYRKACANLWIKG